MFNSSNGRFLAGLLSNGDFKMYNVQTKTCKPVKGLPYFSINSSRGITSKESLECFISNDGNLMLVKYFDKNGVEDLWIWTLLSSIHVKDTLSIDESSKSGIWIRCVFESLNDRPYQVVGLPGDPYTFDQSMSGFNPNQSNSSFSQNHNLERTQSLSFGYDMDVKFVKEDVYEGTIIKIVQSKLYRVENYYKSAIDAQSKRAEQQLDHMKVLEIEYMSYKLNFIKKGGNSILSDYYSKEFKRHACKLEFIAAKENENKVITRFDNKGKLCIIALNSLHMFYCQCYFYSPETNIGYQVKLFNLVKPNDHPSFDSQGKTSLWIDDIQWSPNDLT